jgi:hypothetical protein
MQRIGYLSNGLPADIAVPLLPEKPEGCNNLPDICSNGGTDPL